MDKVHLYRLQSVRYLAPLRVLLYMVVLQSLICFLWIVLKEPEQLNLIKNNFNACLFIGFTGVAGIGWLVYCYESSKRGLVKTLGQVEFIIGLLITYFYFKERISRREYLGIVLIALSVFLMAGYT